MHLTKISASIGGPSPIRHAIRAQADKYAAASAVRPVPYRLLSVIAE